VEWKQFLPSRRCFSFTLFVDSTPDETRTITLSIPYFTYTMFIQIMAPCSFVMQVIDSTAPQFLILLDRERHHCEITVVLSDELHEYG
jgi:hypothetical protein